MLQNFSICLSDPYWSDSANEDDADLEHSLFKKSGIDNLFSHYFRSCIVLKNSRPKDDTFLGDFNEFLKKHMGYTSKEISDPYYIKQALLLKYFIMRIFNEVSEMSPIFKLEYGNDESTCDLVMDRHLLSDCVDYDGDYNDFIYELLEIINKTVDECKNISKTGHSIIALNLNNMVPFMHIDDDNVLTMFKFHEVDGKYGCAEYHTDLKYNNNSKMTTTEH
jgi:hypothetical protein